LSADRKGTDKKLKRGGSKMKRFMVWAIALVFLFTVSGIAAAQAPAAPEKKAEAAKVEKKADDKKAGADKKADDKKAAADKKAEAPAAPAAPAPAKK
jgi:hypothetical protein